MNAVTISLRVTATDPKVAQVSTGRRHFPVGRPLEFDDVSPHVSAIEYALGAVGGEVVNGLREFAHRRRVALDAVEALVTGELAHALTYLDVIGESATPRLTRIHVKVYVASGDPEGARALFDDVTARLPLAGTLRRALDLQVELVLSA